MDLARFHARGLFVVEQMTMIAHACPLLGRKGTQRLPRRFRAACNFSDSPLGGVLDRSASRYVSQSYLIVFEATPERALSAPLVVYALTAKYHFPG